LAFARDSASIAGEKTDQYTAISVRCANRAAASRA